MAVEAPDRLLVLCANCSTANRVPAERLGDDPKCGRCGAPLLDGKPVALDEASFDSFIGRNELPVLVDFWADWCMPCHAVAPILEQIAEERNLTLVKVDYDQEQELAERYGVQSIPNMILFEDGEPRAQTIGALPKSALERALGLT